MRFDFEDFCKQKDIRAASRDSNSSGISFEFCVSYSFHMYMFKPNQLEMKRIGRETGMGRDFKQREDWWGWGGGEKMVEGSRANIRLSFSRKGLAMTSPQPANHQIGTYTPLSG